MHHIFDSVTCYRIYMWRSLKSSINGKFMRLAWNKMKSYANADAVEDGQER